MKLVYGQFKFVIKSRNIKRDKWAKYLSLCKVSKQNPKLVDQDKFFMRQFREAIKTYEIKIIAIHRPTKIFIETVKTDVSGKGIKIPYTDLMNKLLLKVREERQRIRDNINYQNKRFEGAPYRTVGGIMEKPGLVNEIAKNTTMNDPYSHKNPRLKHKNYIGVELEFNAAPGISQQMIADALVNAKLAKYINVTTDASCGWEVRVLLTEDNYIEPLTQIMRVLSALGHGTNERCGAHVHFDMRNRDQKVVYENLFKAQRFLRKLITKSRKTNVRYCKMNRAETFDKQLSLGDRYYAINVQSYSKHQTLEVRMFQGTLNPDELLPWIKLLLKIVNYKTAVTGKINTLTQAKKQFAIETDLSDNLQQQILTLFRTRTATPATPTPGIRIGIDSIFVEPQRR